MCVRDSISVALFSFLNGYNMLVDNCAALIKRLVGRDRALANIVNANDDVHLNDNTLVFTFRGLYQLVGNADAMTYIEFRATLYQGSLNQELGKLGYKVVIAESTGNIDTSWYQLRPVDVV